MHSSFTIKDKTYASAKVVCICILDFPKSSSGSMVFLLSIKFERDKGYDKSWTVLYLEANVSCRKIIGKNCDRSCSVSSQLLAIGATVTGSVVPFNHCHVPPRSFKCYVRLSHGHHYLLSAPPPNHIISNRIIIYSPIWLPFWKHLLAVLKLK